MKNKGFTLIELLAVIVILAIIALIAVPIILDLIGNTKVSASKRSVENYIEAVELYLVRSEMDNNRVTLDRNNKYNVTASTVIGEKHYPSINDLVEITGGKPTGSDDFVQLNEKGKITDAKLTMDGYEVEIKDGKITSVKGGKLIPLESMKLNYIEQTMEKGSLFKLIPSFTPSNASNQEVIYVSSDESIATVDEQGNVSAVNTGYTKITVTSKENESIKVECNITVVVSATEVTITPETAEIRIGKTVQLVGTISPNNVTTNSLEWESSNADIASVDSNGKVTGISVGEVTITASTVNGIKSTSTIIVKPIYENVIEMDLLEGLTPIIYSNNNWKVVDQNQSWYNYDNQEWANAVILKSGVTKNVGDTVNVSSEVQGMFVYVPRYEYKIEGQYGKHVDGTEGTASSPGEIKINFLSKATTTPFEGYRIHPAFTFGTTELSGIWVGKFEPSAEKTSVCYTNASSDNCNNVNQVPYIVPNVQSLRYQNLSNQYATAQKFSKYLKNGDSHMAKNSEWGAVAYLSQSRYGKYGNASYTETNKQVMINNCSSHITGIGADTQDASAISSVCTTNTYETIKGQAASTTGNITGVYDMSGGAWEYTMAVYNNNISTSGFVSLPSSKYYNNYTDTSTKSACNGEVCYGHALSETAEWYGDFASTFSSSNSWIMRGGSIYNTTQAGIFFFNSYGGVEYGYSTFRVILTRS